MPCNNTCCRSVWLKVCKVCDSTRSQLFPLTIPSELCNPLLCWSSCDLPTHIAVSQGRRSLQMEESPHIPATPQQCPSHCNGPSAWFSAFVGFYRPIRAVIMNRFLCIGFSITSFQPIVPLQTLLNVPRRKWALCMGSLFPEGTEWAPGSACDSFANSVVARGCPREETLELPSGLLSSLISKNDWWTGDLVTGTSSSKFSIC